MRTARSSDRPGGLHTPGPDPPGPDPPGPGTPLDQTPPPLRGQNHRRL